MLPSLADRAWRRARPKRALPDPTPIPRRSPAAASSHRKGLRWRYGCPPIPNRPAEAQRLFWQPSLRAEPTDFRARKRALHPHKACRTDCPDPGKHSPRKPVSRACRPSSALRSIAESARSTPAAAWICRSRMAPKAALSRRQ